MRDNDLLRYLRILKKDEISELRKQLSQYKPKLAGLLKALTRWGPGFSPPEIDEQQLFETAFPGESFNLQILRNRNSELKKKIEAFLVGEAIWERPGLRLLLLSSQLGNRKDNAAFTKNLQRLQEHLSTTLHGLDSFFLSFNAHLAELANQATIKNQAKLPPLFQARQALDQTYLTWHLFFELEFDSRSRYIVEERPFAPIDLRNPYWIALINGEGGMPILSLYYKLYSLNTAKTVSISAFEDAFISLRSHAEMIPKSDLQELFRVLTNFTINKYFEPDKRFGVFLLDLYKWGDQQGLFIKDKVISHTTFINITVTAGINKELYFADQFIQKNKAYLLQELREETLQFCYALLAFYQDRYDDAIQFLEETDVPKSFDFSIRRQSLLIRTRYRQYVTGAVDASKVEDCCKAYRQFFARNAYKISENRINKYLKLEYFIRQMTRYSVQPVQSTAFKSLLKEFQDTKCIASEWVEEQLKVL
ncbi:MAG: hypothetical protein H6559_31335 [Lewinellaceae bacterium]|nr:hypothetical protein [Lewinellaceae bacterium]